MATVRGVRGRSRARLALEHGRAPVRRVVSAGEMLAEIDDQANLALRDGRPLSSRYPECLMPIAGAEIKWPSTPEARAVKARYEAFCDAREQALEGYGYNTARAYWSDLQDWFEWAERRQKNVLSLSDPEVKQYLALLRRRQYSESTIRRRLTSIRVLGVHYAELLVN